MRINDSRPLPSRWLYCLIFPLLLGAGCTSLESLEQVPEYTAPPADSEIWDAIDATAAEDWHVLLNDGPTALDWRLRAIDSASDSIDFQTFLWFFDTAGAMVLFGLTGLILFWMPRARRFKRAVGLGS